VTRAFVSRQFTEAYGDAFKAAADRAGKPVELMLARGFPGYIQGQHKHE